MDSDSLSLNSTLKDPALLLWAAGAVAAIFIGFLVYDHFKRGRRRPRFQRRRSLRDKVRTSVKSFKEARIALERRAQQRQVEDERATRKARRRDDH